MNRKHPRPTGASGLALLGAGLVFTSAEIGWADDTSLGAPERTLPAGQTRLSEGTPTPERRPAEHAGLLESGEAEEEPDAIRKLRQALEQRDAAIQNLRAGLEQRDAAIADLLARVEQLERTVGLSSADLDRVTAGRAMLHPSGGGLPPPEQIEAPAADAGPATAAPPEPRTAGRQEQDRDGIPAGTHEENAPIETAQVETPAPGQVEIDEEAAERALDFTLVEQGALLLPAGRVEFTPSFTYTRRTIDFPAVVAPNVLGEEELRRNEFEFGAGLLVGLPFDSQLELALPYNLVDQSAVARVLGVEVEESSDTGHGLGDFSVGLAKTVLRERNWWPDVVLRVRWDSGTGEKSDNDVPLDGGFQELSGSISLLKRQDPLVFVGGAFYEAAFEDDDFDPGDALGFSVGAFLAASPATSLRVVLDQSFIDEFEVDGQSIDGSDRVESVLSFGASAILTRNALLDVSVGVGLTDDSPDYTVSVSLPIRFSTPGL